MYNEDTALALIDEGEKYFYNPIDDDFDEEEDPSTEVLYSNPNPLASLAMSRSAIYRAQGESPSQALSHAWNDVKDVEINPETQHVLLMGALIAGLLALGVMYARNHSSSIETIERGIDRIKRNARNSFTQRNATPRVAPVVRDPHLFRATPVRDRSLETVDLLLPY